jgi:hypothetical protein
VYTLHRRVVRNYRHLPTLAAGLHTEWQADLSDFQRIRRANQGYSYLLVCIDMLSRQIFVQPVKSKHGERMVEAFEKIFLRSKYVPWKLVTDEGKEFTGHKVQQYFASKEMKHFCMYTSPRFHAGMAERANRSIKERLYRYFTHRGTQRWVDVVQKIVDAINESPNSSLDGMRPCDVTFKNAEAVRLQLKHKAETKLNKRTYRRAKFAVGDKVRIEKRKHIFEKGYLPNFTDQCFIIDAVRTERIPVTYKLKTEEGNIVKGWFYAQDLCLVVLPELAKRKKGKNAADGTKDDPIYEIEKILRNRTKDGVQYCYVKWKGYSSQHNSWIPSTAII